MKPLNDPKLEARLTQFGHIDVDFYIAEAKKARSEAVAQQFGSLLKLFKKPAPTTAQPKAI